MTTLSAGDLVNLRTTIHRSTPNLSISQPATLLNALVNNAAITRGARAIVYDSGTGSAAAYAVIAAAVAAGVSNDIGTALMLEVVTATGTELVRVKSITGSQASGTVTVAENGIVWGDNFAITIKHFYQIIPVFPAIRSGVFYKDYDRTFTTTYATQPNPVAIIGQHYAGFLSGGTIDFSLSASSSYAIASGATISSYLWACVKNGSGTTGISFSSTSSATPTLTITVAGQYWLSLTVTDSNGKTQTTYRAVFVYDSSNLPYQDFTIENLSADWDSGQWRCNLTATGTSTLVTIPDGSLAVIWYQNYFDSVEGYVNILGAGDNIVCAGYLWSDNDSDNWESGAGRASFELISPVQYLASITDYGTVSLESKSSPVIWSDYATWLSVGRGIHHLLKWDTTVLEVCDVYGLATNTYGVKVLEFTEDNVLSRINSVANDRGIHAKLTSDRAGRLRLVPDSQMLNTAARAALDTTFSITTADISGGVNVTRNQADVRAFADMDGFTYSHPTSAPFISMIPGYIETISFNLPEPRGTGVNGNKQQVLNSAGGQTDCNERVGRKLALDNVSPKEIRVDMRGNYLGAFEPCVPTFGWYVWNVADNALKRQLALNGIKTVCRGVSYRFAYKDNIFTGIIQTVAVVLQPEAQGPDGIPGNYPTSYPTIAAPSAPIPSEAVIHFTPTYAYYTGGLEGASFVVTSDRMPFSTGTTVANAVSNLSVEKGAHAAISDTVAYGYFVGGFPNGGGDYLTSTDRIVLATGVTSAYGTAVLSIGRESLYGVSDRTTYGYFVAGNLKNSPFITTLGERMSFSTGTIATNSSSDMSAARATGASLSDGSAYGYFAGGYNSGGVQVALTDRITFSTGVTAANSGSNLSTARTSAGPVPGGATYGYFAGGGESGGPVATADRIVFATSVTSANAASNLSAARSPSCSSGDGATYGYFLAVPASTSDRITFATGVTAANGTSDLSSARTFVGGMSDGVA